MSDNRAKGHMMNSALSRQKAIPKPELNGSRLPWPMAHQAWE